MRDTREITAPTVVKALRELGVSNRAELTAIPKKELKAKLKAMGASQYLRTYLLRRLPRPDMDFSVGKLEGEYTKEDLGRISMRDHFAAKAMQAYIQVTEADWYRRREEEPPPQDPVHYLDEVAQWSYDAADAMLKAREQ